MRGFPRQWLGSALLVVAAIVPSEVSAAIHLELRGTSAQLGETVDVGLYAVSDDATEQPISGIDAIIQWDPNVLSLVGPVNNGPYSWAFSMFSNDSQLDGLNDTWADGDALYQCLRAHEPDPPAYATPKGLLVATLRFNAIGPSTASPVRLVPSAGQYTTTRVLDGFDVSNVTGELRSTEVSVLVCGVASDFDADCDVDSGDYQVLHGCLTGPAEPPPDPSCDPTDLNGDSAVDLRDLAWFQLEYMGR